MTLRYDDAKARPVGPSQVNLAFVTSSAVFEIRQLLMPILRQRFRLGNHRGDANVRNKAGHARLPRPTALVLILARRLARVKMTGFAL